MNRSGSVEGAEVVATNSGAVTAISNGVPVTAGPPPHKTVVMPLVEAVPGQCGCGRKLSSIRRLTKNAKTGHSRMAETAFPAA